MAFLTISLAFLSGLLLFVSLQKINSYLCDTKKYVVTPNVNSDTSKLVDWKGRNV
jgi:hypothetical protein